MTARATGKGATVLGKIRNDTISDFLDQVGQRIPAPGGGAAAGVQAGLAGALLSMVARYSSGAKFDRHRDDISRLLAAATELTERSLRAADDDAAAFAAVGTAYALSGTMAADQQHRSAAVRTALRSAVQAPADVIVICGELIAAAEELLPLGNPNVAADIGAAAQSLQAAAATARINLETNRGAVTEETDRVRFRAQIADVDVLIERASTVTGQVRKMVAA